MVFENALLSTMTTTGDNVYRTYMCLICGFIYDEAAGLPDEGIAPGTRWEDVPMNWTCPDCGAAKEDFEMVPITEVRHLAPAPPAARSGE